MVVLDHCIVLAGYFARNNVCGVINHDNGPRASLESRPRWMVTVIYLQ